MSRLRIGRAREGAHRPACALLLAWLAAACAAADAPSEHSGDRVTLLTYDGIEPCAGQVAFYDMFLDRALRLWTSEPPPADFHVELHVMGEDRYIGSNLCPEDSTGCAFLEDATAWTSRQRPGPHELAHLVTGVTDGGTAVALSEGIAEALGRSAQYQLNAWPMRHPDEFLFDDYEEIEPIEYVDAAMYVRYLIDLYGLDAFREYYRSVDRSSTPDEIIAAYEAIFGSAYSDDADEFETEPRCAFQIPYCDDELVPSSLPIVVELVDNSCEDEPWLGFRAPVGTGIYSPYQLHVLDVSATRQITISADDAVVAIGRCGLTCDEQSIVHMFSSNAAPEHTHVLEPGRYFVLVSPFTKDLLSYRAEIR